MSFYDFILSQTGTVTIFTSSFNFGMAYACGVLVLPVILLAFTRTVRIFALIRHIVTYEMLFLPQLILINEANYLCYISAEYRQLCLAWIIYGYTYTKCMDWWYPAVYCHQYI